MILGIISLVLGIHMAFAIVSWLVLGRLEVRVFLIGYVMLLTTALLFYGLDQTLGQRWEVPL